MRYIANAFESLLDVNLREFIKPIAIFFALIALVPFVIGLVGAFSSGLGLLLFLLGAPIVLIGLLIGAVVWLVRGIRLARNMSDVRQRVVPIVASPLLLVTTILLAWPLLVAGGFVGDMARLTMNRSQYEAIIAKARSDHEAAWFAEQRGITYSVDLGPPIRVAFNPEGMLDNWSGIIFDPTGEVMIADGFEANGKFRAPERITKLFGGDLVSCRHLLDDFYACSFT